MSSSPDFERVVVDQLAEMERELRRIRRGTPGVVTITSGVLFGLILYSIIGIVVTMLWWGWVASKGAQAYLEAERRERQKQQAPWIPPAR